MASPEAPTGAERSLGLLATGLARRGHDVALAAPGEWWQDGQDLLESGVELVSAGCRNLWLTAPNHQPWLLHAMRALRFAALDPGARRLARWLASWRPDVVYVNCLPYIRAAAVARDLNLPVVWHLREILPRGARRRWFAGRLRRDGTQLVAVSDAVARWLRAEQLGDQVEVVHNGVATPEEVLGKAQARRLLGLPEHGCLAVWLGQIRPHKGTISFVGAVRRAMDRDSTLLAVLAGPGPQTEVDSLRREIMATAHSRRIFLLPALPDVGHLLAAADIAAVTTLTADPLPRTVLEAMSFGLPVVAYGVGGVPEMVADGETGLLVDVGDEGALARALETVASDEELRRRLGECGRERARTEFSLDRHVDRMEALLRRAAGS